MRRRNAGRIPADDSRNRLSCEPVRPFVVVAASSILPKKVSGLLVLAVLTLRGLEIRYEGGECSVAQVRVELINGHDLARVRSVRFFQTTGEAAIRRHDHGG